MERSGLEKALAEVTVEKDALLKKVQETHDVMKQNVQHTLAPRSAGKAQLRASNMLEAATQA